MRLRLLFLFSLLFFLSGVKSQNFSNKGNDFWLGYGYHVNMANTNGTVNATGGTQDMVLYFTSDKNANVTVEIPSNGYKQTYSVVANQVTETSPLPKTGTQDSRISDTGYFNRGIHIYSDNDIVAYAHIYNASISGASLLFPTNTLGKDYYVISYNQSSNANYANSFAFVVAVEDNTNVEITPSVTNKNGKAAGTPFTVTLNQGQVYSLMGTTSNTIGTDLTGTRIRTISSSGSCKKIAVFCGAGKMSIGGTNTNNNQSGSADNLFAQAMPASAWGLKYLTAPTGSQPNNYYRICVTDPSTVVKLNGTQIPFSYLQRSFFYELKNGVPLSTPGNGIGQPNNGSTTFNLIEADKPITVAQYCTTQGDDGNPSTPGDPEMIYLSPVEQTINKITLNSTSHYQITQHWINVILKKGGTSSFTLDGVNKSSSFIVHPQDANYSYAIFQVNTGSHALYSDTGFNSIAYGFGNAESYGYNAGTNIKDLYTPVFQNPYARVNFAATCAGTPFQFSVPLSYQPTTVTWDFGGSANLSPNTNIGPLTPPNYDSAVFIGGKNLYYYSPANGASVGKSFTYTNPGVDTIKMYVTNPTPDGCGSTNAEYDIPVIISAIPKANFTIPSTLCISDNIQFTDASTNLGTSSVITGIWNWDNSTNTADSTFAKNPTHKFASPKTYNIRYRPITDFGCVGDTIIPFNISAAPIAKFGYNDSCVNGSIVFSDSSTIAAGSIVKWYWDYGDGTKDTLTANTNRTKNYTAAGTINVSLTVENNTGCKSNPFIQTIIIRPRPKPNFNLPIVCMPLGKAQFYDSTKIDDNINTFTYKWDFGDGGIDSIKNPVHYYSSTGTYNVKLIAKSIYGCAKDTTLILSSVYPQPKAAFTVSDYVCLRDTTVYTDGSDGKGSAVVKWRWSFGDGITDTLQNTKHKYAAAGKDSVKLFIYTDKGCVSDTAVKVTVVNTLPTAAFTVAAPNNFCENKPITFTDKAVDNSITTATLKRWHWEMGEGTIKDLTNGGFNTTFNRYYPSYQNYQVKMMVENTIGCKSDTTTQTINIHPQPHVGFTLPEICLSDALANFIDTTTIADGTSSLFTYLWNLNGGSNPISPGPSVVTAITKDVSTHYKNFGHYLVSLKVTSNYGCDTTLTKAFTVNGSTPVPKFAIKDSSNLCSNLPVVFKDLSTVDFGNVTYEDVYWDLLNKPLMDSVDNSPDSLHNKTHSYLYKNFQTPATQKYVVKLVAHSGLTSACADSVTQIITLHQSPKVSFTTLPGICNDTTSKQITQASESGYVPGTFAYYGTGVNTIGLYNPQSVAAGTYPVKYVYTSTTYGCADSATQNETVWPSPVAKWGISSPDCERNGITFTDSSIANYSNIVYRFWDYGDFTYATKTNANNFSKTYAAANTYSASLRVQTDSGCRSTYNIQSIKVNYLPKINFGMPVICLPGGSGKFTDSTTIGDNTSLSYLWNFGDPNDATPSTLPNPYHKYSALGPYNVKLKVVSTLFSCVDSITKIFNTVYPQPKAAFSFPKDSICINDNVQFTDKSNGITSSAVSWNWDLANGDKSTLQNPLKQFIDSGSFNISLYFYNQQGCISDTAVKTIVVNPYPVLTLSSSMFMLEGGSLTIRPSYFYGTNLQFLWSPATYLNSDTARYPVAKPADDITYTLKLTGIGGCAVTSDVFIKVLKSPVVPNAFSPNGDGINDTWHIRYLESYPGASVQVYNRYGEVVFSSVGYAKDWDGTYNGSALPIGTYYYIIDPKNGRQKITGSVTIIK